MKKVLTFIVMLLLLCIVGCEKESVKEKSVETTKIEGATENIIKEGKNDIFTEELLKDIIEINYWNGDKKIVVNDKKTIEDIFLLFSDLTIEKVENSDEKEGYIIVDFITKDGKVSLGILSDSIIINQQEYTIDKDIVQKVRNLIMK